MILVVGATGLLGSQVVRHLVNDGNRVRVFVRENGNRARLEGLDVEYAVGDLRNAASVDAACRGVECVVATATAAAAESEEEFRSIEDQGYENLLRSVQEYGANHFLYASVPATPYDQYIPLYRHKRLTEKRLKDSGLRYSIVRSSPFMEDWLSLVAPSFGRMRPMAEYLTQPFYLAHARRRLHRPNGPTVLVPGNGETRHSFVSRENVARCIAILAQRKLTGSATYRLGGPQALSWNEAVDIADHIAGVRSRVFRTPATAFRLQKRLFEPFSFRVVNLSSLHWLFGFHETLYTQFDLDLLPPEQHISVADFLERAWEEESVISC